MSQSPNSEDEISRVIVFEEEEKVDDEEPAEPDAPDMTNFAKDDEVLTIGHFAMRPELNSKFRSEAVKDIIHTILVEELKGQIYTADKADEWVKVISVKIRNKVKELNYKKYKLMVQVVLGEQKGSGVKIASRCLWDADSDGYSFDTYMNDYLFCTAVCYAVFFY